MLLKQDCLIIYYLVKEYASQIKTPSFNAGRI